MHNDKIHTNTLSLHSPPRFYDCKRSYWVSREVTQIIITAKVSCILSPFLQMSFYYFNTGQHSKQLNLEYQSA